MQVVPIQQWYQIGTSQDTTVPMLTFQPTIDMVEWIKIRNFQYPFPVRISDTGGVYDGIFYARADMIAPEPNGHCALPNQTPLYTLILQTSFTYYPFTNGKVSFVYQKNDH